jgi:hypothetical protein
MHQPRQAVGVLPIQHAVANASPSSWKDVIVTAHGEGWIETVGIDDDRRRTFATTAVVVVGEPVAAHLVAELLSVGSERFTARTSH